MAQVDLSTLSGTELRRLLDSTRSRGQASQSYRILQEMEARRMREAFVGGKRRPALGRRRDSTDSRVITLDLGDPLERGGEFPPGHDGPAPGGDAALSQGLTLAPAVRRPPRRAPWLGLGFVAGAALGLAFAGWTGGIDPGPPPAATGAGLQIAAGAEPAAMPAAAPAVPAGSLPVVAPASTTPETAAIPADADAGVGGAPPPEASVLPRADIAPEQTEVAQMAPPPAEPEAASGCGGEPTPADRTICGDPQLRRLQLELRQAYAQALDAHQDRALLRRRQLAWRDARDTVAEPRRLAQLYAERIRRLNAATADAQRRR